jgi:hypothetical protein
MKKLLMALCLLPALANAESYYATNKTGGRVVITSNDCWMGGTHYPEWGEAYTYSGTTHQMTGACWAYVDGAIHIIYDDGDRRVYPLEYFRKVED